MLNAILGTKQKMTQAWTEDGKRVSVTIIQAGPVVVTAVKTQEKNGYDAIQLGFGEKKVKNITKPLLGHFKKLQTEKTPKLQTLPRFLREVKIQEPTTHNQLPELGDVLKASDVLAPGDRVLVTGVSKGKGFQGVVKRWGFRGGPRTHGQSDRERAPGSIGQTTTPGRVLKGKKMAKRMGGERVSIKNLTVLSVEGEGRLLLSGPVPGGRGSLLYIEKISQDKRFKGMSGEGKVEQGDK